MQKIVRVKDVINELGVSKSTASRMIKKVIKHFNLDTNRLPVQGSVPENLFNEYFQFNIVKGDKKWK